MIVHDITLGKVRETARRITHGMAHGMPRGIGRCPVTLSVVALLLTGLLVGPATSQAAVHVVDPGGAGDFTTVAAAVEAAGDGDLVLVKAGTYEATPPFSEIALEGRSLAIVADAGAIVTVKDRLRVGFQEPGDAVLLQGLLFEGSTTATTLFTHNGDGALWVERCVIGAPLPGGSVAHGLDVFNAGAASVMSTAVTGPSLHYSQSTGMTCIGSDVFLYDSSFAAGTTQPDIDDVPVDGGNALYLPLGTGYASGCDFLGGDGGPGTVHFFFGCLASGSGGAGMQLGPNPLGQAFRHAGSNFLGGAAGPGVAPCFTQGPAGLPIEVHSGELTAIAGGARTLQVSSPVREGGIVDVTVTGLPGEQVFFLLSGTHDPRYIAQHEASVLVGQPLPFVHAGPLPAGGTLQLSATVPDVGLGPEQALVLYVQAGFAGAGDVTTSGGAALVVLDEGL